jgi:hypothetical protein
VPEYPGSNPTASTKVFTQFEFFRSSGHKQVLPPWAKKLCSAICQTRHLNSWQQQQTNQRHLAPIPSRSGYSTAGNSNSNFNSNPSKTGITGFTAGSFPVLQVQGNKEFPLETEMCRQKKREP